MTLEGETKISDCLVPSQGTGQLQNIGQTLVVTATKLNAEARHDPSGPAALQLGFDWREATTVCLKILLGSRAAQGIGHRGTIE